MSRPKGSKNKKTLLSEAQIGDRIAEQMTAKKRLEAEQKKILKSLELNREQLKLKRKELRTVERTLEILQTRKEEIDAANAAAVQKKEVEKVVSTLISRGKSADEILDLLGK